MRIALVLGVLPVLLSLPLVHAQNEVRGDDVLAGKHEWLERGIKVPWPEA